MVSVSDTAGGRTPDLAETGPVAGAIDRFIYVGMAAWFLIIVLAGFVPDSFMKLSMIEAGKRPAFPLVAHVHAVVMGAFLLLLMAQASLGATGNAALHRRLGLAAFGLAPLLVVVGFILVPVSFRELWDAVQAAPPAARDQLQGLLDRRMNVTLLQIRSGVLFSLFVGIALYARRRDPGLHKRMMFLAVAVPLTAAFSRMEWLPSTLPASPLSGDLYVLLAVSPMFAWDLIRTRTVPHAYLIFLAAALPATIAVHAAWGSAGWRALVPRLLGVA